MVCLIFRVLTTINSFEPSGSFEAVELIGSFMWIGSFEAVGSLELISLFEAVGPLEPIRSFEAIQLSEQVGLFW